MYACMPTEERQKERINKSGYLLNKKCHGILCLYKDGKTKTETDLVSVSPKPWYAFVFRVLKKRNLKFNMKHSCAQILQNILISEAPKSSSVGKSQTSGKQALVITDSDPVCYFYTLI